MRDANPLIYKSLIMRGRTNNPNELVEDDNLCVASHHISRINSWNLHEKWSKLEKEAEAKRIRSDKMRYLIKELKLSPEDALMVLNREKPNEQPHSNQPLEKPLKVIDDDDNCLTKD